MKLYKVDHSNDRAGHFHPSSAGYCLSKQAYEFYGIPQEHSAQTQAIFDLGHVIHDSVQRAWQRHGVLHTTEHPVTLPEYLVSGHVDGVGAWDGQPMILEIKSINSRGFIKPLPKLEHIEQVQLYMYMLQIPVALLLYINKDFLKTGRDLATLEMHEYLDPQYFRLCLQYYNSGLIKRRLRQYDVLKECVKQGKVFEDIRYSSMSMECQYCSYNSHCRERGL